MLQTDRQATGTVTYRVTMVFANLGWVDLDFRSSLAGWPLL